MTEKIELIHKAMAGVVADAEGIGKTKRNEQQNYNYRGYDDLVPHVKEAMAKHGVYCVLESIDDLQMSEYESRQGARMKHVIVSASYRFFASDGSSIGSKSLGEGSDSGDKAINKALTSAEKNLIVHRFLLATGEETDSEADHADRASSERPAARASRPSGGSRGISEPMAGKIIGVATTRGKQENRHGWDVLREVLAAMNMDPMPDKARRPEVIEHLRKVVPNGQVMDEMLELIDKWPDLEQEPPPPGDEYAPASGSSDEVPF